MYDDSDGAYDHVMPPILNDSQTVDDALTGTGLCGTSTPILGGYQGRCGYGPRLPLLIISPWARINHVDHTLTDQTSVIHFVEDNWLGGERIGDGSYDALSGPLTGMFNFAEPQAQPRRSCSSIRTPASRSARTPIERRERRSSAFPSDRQDGQGHLLLRALLVLRGADSRRAVELELTAKRIPTRSKAGNVVFHGVLGQLSRPSLGVIDKAKELVFASSAKLLVEVGEAVEEEVEDLADKRVGDREYGWCKTHARDNGFPDDEAVDPVGVIRG